jgi:hypothetical protein
MPPRIGQAEDSTAAAAAGAGAGLVGVAAMVALLWLALKLLPSRR